MTSCVSRNPTLERTCSPVSEGVHRKWLLPGSTWVHGPIREVVADDPRAAGFDGIGTLIGTLDGSDVAQLISELSQVCIENEPRPQDFLSETIPAWREIPIYNEASGDPVPRCKDSVPLLSEVVRSIGDLRAPAIDPQPLDVVRDVVACLQDPNRSSSSASICSAGWSQSVS